MQRFKENSSIHFEQYSASHHQLIGPIKTNQNGGGLWQELALRKNLNTYVDVHQNSHYNS